MLAVAGDLHNCESIYTQHTEPGQQRLAVPQAGIEYEGLRGRVQLYPLLARGWREFAHIPSYSLTEIGRPTRGILDGPSKVDCGCSGNSQHEGVEFCVAVLAARQDCHLP